MNYNGKKTVFIDDNNVMINIIKKKLEGYGLSVDKGNSMAELFELLKTNNYDILFLDDMMSIMTGTQAMQKLKGESYPIPIVVITGNESPEDRQKYLDAGFDDYIGKTYLNERLPEVLKKFLD